MTADQNRLTLESEPWVKSIIELGGHVINTGDAGALIPRERLVTSTPAGLDSTFSDFPRLQVRILLCPQSTAKHLWITSPVVPKLH